MILEDKREMRMQHSQPQMISIQKRKMSSVLTVKRKGITKLIAGCQAAARKVKV